MKIAILIPCHGDTKALFTLSLADMLVKTTGHEIKNYLGRGSNLPAIRNNLADAARNWGADFILWLDADHLFPASTLLQLLAHRKEVVGCNYPQRQSPDCPVAVKQGRFVHTSEGIAGLEQVDSVGLGVCLMAASVFDGVPRPYFEFTTTPDGSPRGEDRNFFAKLKAPVFVDHGLSQKVGHIGEQILVNAHTGRQNADTVFASSGSR